MKLMVIIDPQWIIMDSIVIEPLVYLNIQGYIQAVDKHGEYW